MPTVLFHRLLPVAFLSISLTSVISTINVERPLDKSSDAPTRVNIASAKGTSVVAAENGVVAYAGNEIKGMGNLIIVQHESGWMTVYAHLDSMNVKRGTKVNVGQKIGTVGETGKVDSPQLHFEIRKGTKAYDPISYMKK